MPLRNGIRQAHATSCSSVRTLLIIAPTRFPSKTPIPVANFGEMCISIDPFGENKYGRKMRYIDTHTATHYYK